MYDDTIASIAGGMGGAIGIIRVSGPDSCKIVSEIFSKSKKKIIDKDFFINAKSHTIHYGFIFDENDEVVDEVIVLLMKGPNSYTKEDVIEIDCHGGAFVTQKILELLFRKGIRSAEPGEFTKRAFLNGRIDLSQAEAVMNLISSENKFAHKSAINQLEGRVSNYIEEIRQRILNDIAFIESALDDPEHFELDGFSDDLKNRICDYRLKLNDLLDKFDDGRMKTEGINTVIVGKPNAGKSSLMNLLLDSERAIVTDIAGTTRDILEEKVRIGDLILNLVDTAGIRKTDDVVENIGVSKAKSFVENADFILFLIDTSSEIDREDREIMELVKNKSGIILLNKCDLDRKFDENDLDELKEWKKIYFSNETKEGLDELEKYIKESFLMGDITYNNQVYLTNVRHKNVVVQALNSLDKVLDSIESRMPEDFYTIDLMDAYEKLGLINGRSATEDLVDKIFKEFCMGK